MTEIWKDIKGYEGLYQVSSLGRVKSLNYRGVGKERILKGCRKTTDGYIQYSLIKEGKSFNKYGHRLVAEAFIPNPDIKSDGIKIYLHN